MNRAKNNKSKFKILLFTVATALVYVGAMQSSLAMRDEDNNMYSMQDENNNMYSMQDEDNNMYSTSKEVEDEIEEIQGTEYGDIVLTTENINNNTYYGTLKEEAEINANVQNNNINNNINKINNGFSGAAPSFSDNLNKINLNSGSETTQNYILSENYGTEINKDSKDNLIKTLNFDLLKNFNPNTTNLTSEVLKLMDRFSMPNQMNEAINSDFLYDFLYKCVTNFNYIKNKFNYVNLKGTEVQINMILIFGLIQEIVGLSNVDTDFVDLPSMNFICFLKFIKNDNSVNWDKFFADNALPYNDSEKNIDKTTFIELGFGKLKAQICYKSKKQLIKVFSECFKYLNKIKTLNEDEIRNISLKFLEKCFQQIYKTCTDTIFKILKALRSVELNFIKNFVTQFQQEKSKQLFEFDFELKSTKQDFLFKFLFKVLEKAGIEIGVPHNLDKNYYTNMFNFEKFFAEFFSNKADNLSCLNNDRLHKFEPDESNRAEYEKLKEAFYECFEVLYDKFTLFFIYIIASCLRDKIGNYSVAVWADAVRRKIQTGEGDFKIKTYVTSHIVPKSTVNKKCFVLYRLHIDIYKKAQ